MKKLLASLLFTAVIGCATTGSAGVLSLAEFSGLPLEDAVAVPSAIVTPYTYTGTTVAGPTFTRPGGTGAESYDVTSFTIAATGTYNFLSDANYPNALYVYSGSFNPAAPSANLVAGAVGTQPFATDYFAGFSSGMSTGVTYFLVTTGNTSADAGNFTDTIRLSSVPEPSTWAMMGAGLVGLVAVQRLRRRSA